MHEVFLDDQVRGIPTDRLTDSRSLMTGPSIVSSTIGRESERGPAVSGSPVTYDSTDDSSVTTLGRRARDFPEIYMEFLFQTNVLTTCHACIHTYVRKHILLVFSTTLKQQQFRRTLCVIFLQIILSIVLKGLVSQHIPFT